MSTANQESKSVCIAEIAGVEYWLHQDIEPQQASEAIIGQARPKVIVVGGFAAQLGLSTLAQTIEDHKVLHALLIGEDTMDLAKALLGVGFSHFTAIEASDETRLVETLYHLTEPGDAALLFGPSFGAVESKVMHAVGSLKDRVDAD